MCASRTQEKARPQSESKAKLSAKVSARVEIEEVSLLSADVRRSDEFKPGKTQVEFQPEIAYRLDKANSRISLKIRFVLTLSNRDRNEKTYEALKFDVVFVLTYKLSSLGGLTRSHFSAFGELNGVFNVWPYWREFVQSTTTRMGLPPLMVPSLKLFGKSTVEGPPAGKKNDV